MLPELNNQVDLFEILYKIDKELAEKIKQRPCPYCGSALHTANYNRKPRGVNASIPDEFLRQQSLCCSNEECRKRVQPPIGSVYGPTCLLDVRDSCGYGIETKQT
jgi:ribosomal protein S27AE